jgi:hypothetical protein
MREVAESLRRRDGPVAAALQRDLIQHVRVPTSFTVAAWISVGTAVIAFNVMLFDLLVPGHLHRWPVYASVAVLGCESLVCFFLGSDEWTEQYLEGAASLQTASVHARFAVELCSIGALHLLASIALLRRQWDWLWWLVLGMQVGVFGFAQLEAQLIDPNSPGWSVFSRLPLIAVFLLLGFRLAQAMQKRTVDRDLAPSLTP